MIYTAITGGKDNPRTDILCFTDYDKFTEPRRNAKIYRALSHLYVDDEYSLWCDGNIELKVTEETLISLMDGYDVLAFQNPYRNCLYDEAEECIRLGLDDETLLREQVERYRQASYNAKNGLWQTGVLLRRHTDQVKRLNEAWWAEICRGSMRDQVSFPFVFHGKVKTLEIGGDPFDNPWFRKGPHKLSRNGKL